jgi:hypothetical protein
VQRRSVDALLAVLLVVAVVTFAIVATTALTGP